MKKTIFFVVLIFIFNACGAVEYTVFNGFSHANLRKVSWSNLKGFKKDSLTRSFQAFKLACTKTSKVSYLTQSCNNTTKYIDAKKFFKNNFTPYAMYNDSNTNTGLITGYYEPLLKGSLEQSRTYRYPIYKTPKDLITVDLSSIYPNLSNYKLRGRLVGNTLVPYYSRKNLQNSKHLKAICYVKSRINRFFLEIQGSGKILLKNGNTINVSYADQNGQKYISIGKTLVDMGVMKEKDLSLQNIKRYLLRHPRQVNNILNSDNSVVFFSQNKGEALGALGVPLIAGVNIAVDKRYIPLGLPVFLSTTNPINKKIKINLLTIAADVGGAIQGKVRADFYFGSGQKAASLAGVMRENGLMYILVPNSIAVTF